MEKKLFLLDAFSLIYRGYYALISAPRITSKQVNTSAVFGFCNTLEDLIKKQQPTHMAVCFDPKGGHTYRHDIYPEYKANREAQPEAITQGLPYIKRILEAMRIPMIEVENYEADDVIGTLAKRAEKEGYTTYMMTMDKDFGQLVSDKTLMYRPPLRGDGFEIRGPKEVCERYGIADTKQVIDILALEGDASDNIPGVPKVGEKTAAKYIAQWGSVENILANLESFKGKAKENLESFADRLLLNKELVTINTNVPIDFNIDEMVRQEPDYNALREIYNELEFKSFLAKLPSTSSVSRSESSGSGKESTSDGTAGASSDMGLFSMDFSNDTPSEQVLDVPFVEVNAEYNRLSELNQIKDLVEKARGCEYVGISLYTIGEEAMIADWKGIAISTEAGKASYFEIDHKTLELIKPLFSDEKVILVSHDIKRDMVVSNQHGVALTAKYYDTSLAHYLLESEARHDLPEVAYQYLGGYKTDEYQIEVRKRKYYQVLPADVVVNHFCESADIQLRLRDRLQKAIEKEGMTPLLYNIELPMAAVLARMEQNGVRIDEIELYRLSQALKHRLHEMEGEAFDLAGCVFNASSPSQVGDILFGKLKLDPNAKKTKTGGYSTTEQILEKYVDAHPLVKMILDIRKIKKLITTYVDSLPTLVLKKTGKIHTTFNQTVTSTGRISSTNPNLQNIPIRTEDGKEIRRAFIPDKDCILLAADYSQIELRLIADISKDEAMIEAFHSGEDIHAATAAKIYGVPLKDVTSDMRRNAKTANFGIIYGISAFGLSQRLGIPRSEAKEIIDNYMKTYPSIAKYIERAINDARDKGFVVTVNGRKRQLPEINSRNATVRSYAERNAINAPIQGSAADIIKIAMVRIDEDMRKENLKSTMILQVHDELVFNVVPEELEKLSEIVTRDMVNAYSGSVPLEVSAGTGRNWLEAH